MGIGHRHLQGGEGQGRVRGDRSDAVEVGGTPKAAPRDLLIEQRRDELVDEDAERPVDVLVIEGRVGQCRALTPSLDGAGVAGPRATHDPDQGQRSTPVHSSGRGHRVRKGQFYPPQLDGVDGDGPGPTQPGPPFVQGWRWGTSVTGDHGTRAYGPGRFPWSARGERVSCDPEEDAPVMSGLPGWR